MSLSLFVAKDYYIVGSASFLKSFFSTIYFYLVKDKMSNRYPKVFYDLYSGHLNWENASEVLENLKEIREKLKELSPDKVIWDMDNLSLKPPWGDNISPNITSLSNYYKTNNGKDLFEILFHVLEQSIRTKSDVIIK